MTNWLDASFRKEFIKGLKAKENKDRKAKSLQEYEIYNGNITQYVQQYLTEQLSAKTVKRMPIISSIEICRRIADQEASVYKSEPRREYLELSEDDSEALEYVYEDSQADVKLMKSNRYFKLQSQNLIQVILKDSKIDLRVLFPHNYDIIPDPNDPERAESVIISAFDKENYVNGGDSPASNNFVTGNTRDNQNQTQADQDDYKRSLEKYVVWSKEFNFIMDGNGAITSGPDVKNPIGVLPFVDVASDKDFTFFVDRGSQLANFAVQYNAALSDLANIVRLQGYSQAVFIAPKETMPDSIEVGPTTIIKIASDPNSATQPDFRFVTPSPDLAGSIQFIETLISNFLSSRGLSPATVSGKSEGDKFTSGIDRFLALIDRFEATKQDFALYNQVELKLFEIFKAYLVTYSGNELLNRKYWSSDAVKNAELKVHFAKPEQTQSEIEKLTNIEKRMALGLMDRTTALMSLDGLDKSEAEQRLKEIEASKVVNDEDKEPKTNREGSQPDAKP
jgi:hypothetical protein